jgi:MYXO-CTERM domain-containing protein
MSIGLRNGLEASVLVISGLAGSAHATLFSFASDHLPTFTATAASGGSFTISTPANDKLNLLIDDNNGPHPALTSPVGISANLTATYTSMAGFGSFISYNYAVSGTINFVDQNTNAVLMTISVGGPVPAMMTVPGIATSWSTSGAIIGSDQFSSNLTYTLTQAGFTEFSAAATAAGQNLSSYGITSGGSQLGAPGSNDFGFTLTSLTQPGGAAVTLGQDHLPSVGWQSESSFSGTTGSFSPAPGAAALLGFAGLRVSRRRRD